MNRKLRRACEEAEYQQSVRHHSIKIISGIAAGAVLLSAFFLIIIGRDITRSNRYRRELEEARCRAELAGYAGKILPLPTTLRRRSAPSWAMPTCSPV